MATDDYDRRMQALDEQRERELELERIADHTPAHTPELHLHAPRPSTPMLTLAYTVLNGPDHDRRDAARVLAELVLEAGDEQAR